MKAHTPGPWTVVRNVHYKNEGKLMIWGPKGPGHGTVAEASSYRPEAQANAHLIAAAPELLKMLERVVEGFDERRAYDERHHVKTYDDSDFIIEVRALISRAKGEQS